ncbi:MAG: cytochrome C oxidase subunit IV family protein [Myxococcota bacterium]
MAHDTHEEHHALPPVLLIGTWLGLMALTGLTVWTATSLDLGQFNLVLAMIIASAKATLVLTIFMHLAFDKGFNFMIFATSVLAVVLFVVVAFIDVSEYKPDVDRKRADIERAAAAEAQ